MQSRLPRPMFFRQLFDRTSCTFTYLLADPSTREALLIDPVDTQLERDLTLLSQHDLTLRYALNTHAHADHISATGLLKRRLRGVQSVIGRASRAKADVLLEDGDVVEVGAVRLRCMYTPGHTEGCVSYVLDGERGMVFTGDALLVRGCGRTDFQGGDSELLFRSVRQGLFALAEDTRVYPAHDYRGHLNSTIGEEKRWNPRLGDGKSLDEFVQIMDGLGLAYPKMMDKAVPANMNCGIQPE